MIFKESIRYLEKLCKLRPDLCEQVELLANIEKMPDGLDPGELPKDRVRKLREYLYD